MCITHTPHRPHLVLSQWRTLSDLGHFIMPFTCLHTHTCAECVLHKLHITHTPRRGFFSRKFMQAKSKIRWQINYAQNSWPLCWVRSVNWLQTRCRTKTKEQIVVVGNSTAAGSSSSSSSEFNINFSYSSSSSSGSTSTLATGREAAASLRSRARKTYFRIHQQAKVVPDLFVSPDFTSSYCCQCPLQPLCPPAVPVDCLARFLLPTLQRN